ncbi:hypothetical protein ACETRX_28490 [Labrys portucalensis]|uniref:Uncharacterized protein n=1 Tax=Labrys neptuniae TaxID=376174 RepID=A0ABV6ZN21_9HYPH
MALTCQPRPDEDLDVELAEVIRRLAEALYDGEPEPVDLDDVDEAADLATARPDGRQIREGSY